MQRLADDVVRVKGLRPDALNPLGRLFAAVRRCLKQITGEP